MHFILLLFKSVYQVLQHRVTKPVLKEALISVILC